MYLWEYGKVQVLLITLQFDKVRQIGRVFITKLCIEAPKGIYYDNKLVTIDGAVGGVPAVPLGGTLSAITGAFGGTLSATFCWKL